MKPRCRSPALLAAVLFPLLLAACGGGQRPADVVPSTQFPNPPLAVSGPDRFLLWLNPLITPDASPPKVDSLAYAEAYYAAIDPDGLKDTLAKWKTANGFGQAGGIETSAIFGDFRDLGYGRRMTGRCDADTLQPTRCAKGGRVAFLVENFLANPSAEGYGAAVNLDAAVVNDRQWIVSVNAIEFSPGPSGGVSFAKFYSFDPLDGRRRLTQNLDGRGEKALPGACISCHGGRADALTAKAGGGWQMPLLQGFSNAQRGDVLGRFHPFDVTALTFQDAAGYRAADLQSPLKLMNQMVLCTYPLKLASPAPEDACRQLIADDPWLAQAADPAARQAGPADYIKLAYGGQGLPGASFVEPELADIAPGWVAQADLYNSVVAPACIGCHRLLGTQNAPAISFGSFAAFSSYNASHRSHVFERGDMPLARVLYQNFWSLGRVNSGQARKFADYLRGAGLDVRRTAAGEPELPGVPLAIAGPDRRVLRQGSVALSAANSLFADSYRWRIVSGPNGVVPFAGARIDGAESRDASFVATDAALAAQADYVVELTAARAGVAGPAQTLKVTVVIPPAAKDPASYTFDTDIGPMLGANGCLACHTANNTPLLAFNGTNGFVDSDAYTVVRSMLNFSDLSSSRLVSKAAGEHHSGGSYPAFDRAMVFDWALRGAPR